MEVKYNPNNINTAPSKFNPKGTVVITECNICNGTGFLEDAHKSQITIEETANIIDKIANTGVGTKKAVEVTLKNFIEAKLELVKEREDG